MNQNWPDLRRRTARVRAALPEAPATPLSEADLIEAEQQFGVRLPDGYREFLTHIDSGGHGPSAGLLRLRRGPGGWSWEDWQHERTARLEALNRPFPDQEDIQARLDALVAPAEHGSPEWREWDARCDALVTAQTDGTITFSGDSTFPMLVVVTGPQRGAVWCDMRATTDVLALVRKPDGSAATFTDLYVEWLVTAERLLDAGRTEVKPWDIRPPMVEAIFHP